MDNGRPKIQSGLEYTVKGASVLPFSLVGFSRFNSPACSANKWNPDGREATSRYNLIVRPLHAHSDPFHNRGRRNLRTQL